MRVLVISDIHANLVAFEAVLEDAGEYDAVWNLGDTVGYGPRPGECIERVVELDADPSLAGNHDWAAVGRLTLDEFNPIARVATQWTTDQLLAEHVAYLDSLPNRTIADEWMLVHASPRQPIWEYVYSAAVAKENFEYFDQQVCFLGHTHVQLYISETMAKEDRRPILPEHGDTLCIADTRYIVNPGSVGQPRDNIAAAAYAIFDTVGKVVTFRRTEYDVARTQVQMEKAGLPRPLITRLALGV